MKTGSFALLRNEGLTPNAVSIALGKSKYYEVYHYYKKLAPSWSLLCDFRDDKITEEEYVAIYNKQLQKLDAKKVYEELLELTCGNEPILMCHCGKQYFCHRHLVAEWLEKELGIKVEEYNCSDKIHKNGYLVDKPIEKKSFQLMLF